MELSLEISATEVSITGDASFRGTYAITPSQTTGTQVFFSGERNRAGSLMNNGTVRITQMDFMGKQALLQLSLDCHKSTTTPDASSNRFGPGR